MVADVFVSYARGDADLAAVLSRKLRARGLSVFFDQGSLAAGEGYSETIKKALLQAKAVIVLLSHNSRRNDFVEQEVRVALEKGRVVVPVLLDETATENWIWPLISNWQPIKLKTPEEIDRVAQKVDQSLGFKRRKQRIRSAIFATSAFLLIAVTMVVFAFSRFRVQVNDLKGQLANSQRELVALRAQLSKAVLPLQQIRVVLTTPIDGAQVASPSIPIEGKVSLSTSQQQNIMDVFRDGDVELVVFVRPSSADRWWLQSSPQLSREGTFRGTAFLDEHNCEAGSNFEIIVLAIPKHPTGPDDLPDLPYYYARSQPIKVRCL